MKEKLFRIIEKESCNISILLNDFKNNKDASKCERYFTLYNNGKYHANAMEEYNSLLFQFLTEHPTRQNFFDFFENAQERKSVG